MENIFLKGVIFIDFLKVFENFSGVDLSPSPKKFLREQILEIIISTRNFQPTLTKLQFY